MKFYKELLMEHYKNPRNRGRIENPTFSTAQFNPSCGDSILFDVLLENGIIKKISFEGKGCVVSMATCSIFTEYFVGKRIDEVLAFQKENIKDIIGMDLGNTRIKCALLSLVALQEGIAEYQGKASKKSA